MAYVPVGACKITVGRDDRNVDCAVLHSLVGSLNHTTSYKRKYEVLYETAGKGNRNH